jgi:hypothetical protein
MYGSLPLSFGGGGGTDTSSSAMSRSAEGTFFLRRKLEKTLLLDVAGILDGEFIGESGGEVWKEEFEGASEVDLCISVPSGLFGKSLLGDLVECVT